MGVPTVNYVHVENIELTANRYEVDSPLIQRASQRGLGRCPGVGGAVS